MIVFINYIYILYISALLVIQSCNPKHSFQLRFPFKFYESVTGLRLNDETDIKFRLWIGACCLSLARPIVAKLEFSLSSLKGIPWKQRLHQITLIVCVSRAIFFVSSLCVNVIILLLCEDGLQCLGSVRTKKTFGV